MNTVFEFAFISLYLSISSPQKNQFVAIRAIRGLCGIGVLKTLQLTASLYNLLYHDVVAFPLIYMLSINFDKTGQRWSL